MARAVAGAVVGLFAAALAHAAPDAVAAANPLPAGALLLAVVVAIAACGTGAAGWLAGRRRERRARELCPRLAQFECLLWEARVTQHGDEMKWRFRTFPSRLGERLFSGLRPRKPNELWDPLNLPEHPQMDALSTQALLSGAPGYEQVFRISIGPDMIWLQERVAIVRRSEGVWDLFGAATDITVQRQAEEAVKAKEAQARDILARADCLVWRAQVRRRQDSLEWVLFDLPTTGLYARLFGDRAPCFGDKLWSLLNVPEMEEMNARSRAAVLGGAPGYEQEFRIVKPEGTLWMQEHVSIFPSGVDAWNLIGVLTDVTPRRAAEAARRASEAHLQQILNGANCLLWQAHVLQRPPGQGGTDWQMYVPASSLYRELFGDKADTARAMMWTEADVPDLPEMNRRADEAIRSGAPGYEQVIRVLRGERIYWLHEQVSIARAGPGEWHLVGVVVDISARRQAETGLRASEARFRALFEHAPVAIAEADFAAAARWAEQLTGSGGIDLAWYLEARPEAAAEVLELARVTDANDAAVRLLKARDLAEAKARWLSVLPPRTLGRFLQLILQPTEVRDVIEAEFGVRDLEGAKRHVHVRCWIGRRDGAPDLSHTVIAVVDLTDLKRTEAALAAEKERLAVTLRAMADGVITTDTTGRVLFVNRAASELLGCNAESIVGRRVAEVFVLHEEPAQTPFEVPIDSVLEGDRIVDFPARAALVGRDGRVRAVHGCCAPVHGAASEIVGTVLVFRDMTERVRLDKELARASKLESVGVLAGGIAHDFNNILTVVIGNINLATLDVKEPDVRESLREAGQAALRARELTQQLLTFAKGGDPVRSAVRLGEVLSATAIFALHGSRTRCEFDVPENLWPVDADKGQIGQVVQNLVINAAQAMPDGGVIRIAAHNELRAVAAGRRSLPQGDYVRISVSDTGVGISPENLARIFDPYFTTKQQGSGLGLATVYSIVRKHRGDIDVESQPGVGTTFHFWLPALPGRVVDTQAPASTVPPVLRGRILFMDDEDSIRKMAASMLRRLGLETVLAADGGEAVRLYQEAMAHGQPFDLVITDLTVPGGMGGRETFARLRTLDPQVKAIVSSGYSSDPVMADFRAHGFQAMVIKPYRVDDLVRVLGDVLAAPAAV